MSPWGSTEYAPAVASRRFRANRSTRAKRSTRAPAPSRSASAREADVLREIGECVRRAREAADLTQERAAELADIDYKRWQKLEQGGINATTRTLLRVADAVGTDIFGLMAYRGTRGRRKRRK